MYNLIEYFHNAESRLAEITNSDQPDFEDLNHTATDEEIEAMIDFYAHAE